MFLPGAWFQSVYSGGRYGLGVGYGIPNSPLVLTSGGRDKSRRYISYLNTFLFFSDSPLSPE